MKKSIILKTIARSKVRRITFIMIDGLLQMIKGITGIIIIMLAVIAVVLSCVICLPLLLFGNMKQNFKTDQ